MLDNKYTIMQKRQYSNGTNNHEQHNMNPNYWDVLLGDLKNARKWKNKVALDFACGKGRNVSNLLQLCEWERVDGVDISEGNIDYNKQTYATQKSEWYCNNGVDLSELRSDEYHFVMSTIALQHISVYDIRASLIKEIYRVLKPEGLFSFQMGYGDDLESPLGPRVSYFENYYDAPGTNSICDVRVQRVSDVVEDLTSIGFHNISTKISESYLDDGHPQWIYIKAYKK